VAVGAEAVEGDGSGGSGGSGGEVALHEETRVEGEAGVEEGRGGLTVVVEQELGLDAGDGGGVEKDLEKVAEEGAGDLERSVGGGGDGEGVADDGLGPLVDAEGVAADAAVIEGDEAGEDLGVEVLEEELGGAAIVPEEVFTPEEGLLLEQGAELTRVEMTNVENLYLGRCRQFPCHLEREYRRWELDGKRRRGRDQGKQRQGIGSRE
jgi:hypothetical protein